MDFWKEFSKTVSSAADHTVKGAERLTDMAKLKYKISSLSTKLDEAYTSLGRLKYSELTGDEIGENEYAELTEKISELNAQLTEAEGMLFDLMNFISCPQCGTRLKKGCNYCHNCGNKF